MDLEPMDIFYIISVSLRRNISRNHKRDELHSFPGEAFPPWPSNAINFPKMLYGITSRSGLYPTDQSINFNTLFYIIRLRMPMHRFHIISVPLRMRRQAGWKTNLPWEVFQSHPSNIPKDVCRVEFIQPIIEQL